MKTLCSLIILLLISSCAMTETKKEMSMQTKVELSTAPDLSKPMIAQLLLEILKNSEIENEEKLKILDAIKIYITEFTFVRAQKNRAFSAFLKTLNSPDDKAFKEINELLKELAKKELDIQLKLLSYIKKNLKGKGDDQLTQSIIDAITNQSQGFQTNQEMNQI
ncbi:hypothetical protein [Halobacteriovorax sp. HLS]|uniref:hypothetical protein n=1 Tax=Halobacteriovorax sp. HLS TaxID=2234000 RepID=UPI000FD830C7|nr:hypothetical protein [Halobacteriovorax sp. HLS]